MSLFDPKPLAIPCPHLSGDEPCSLCVELHHARATIIRQGAEVQRLTDESAYLRDQLDRSRRLHDEALDQLARLRPGEYPRP